MNDRDPCFTLVGAEIRTLNGRLLGPLRWTVPAAGVTVVMGPAGGGKSSLLRALAGASLPPGWTRTGGWLHRGQPLGGLQPDVTLVPQRRQASLTPGVGAPDASHRWREAFQSGGRTLLLDEPCRGLESSQREELVLMLRALGRIGAAVVVTHDQRFARAVADRVCLLVDGVIEADCPADRFFTDPPTKLAERFVRQGNCWPEATLTPLPDHFHWLEEGRLAGMGEPGLLRDADADLESIAQAGVTRLVSLTEKPFPKELLRRFGLQGLHHPIRDMGVPSVGSSARICRTVERDVEAGECVAFHCRAGLGRTGTMLATYLVWQGEDPESAIARVRSVASGYIQVAAQERFVQSFAESFPPRPGTTSEVRR